MKKRLRLKLGRRSYSLSKRAFVREKKIILNVQQIAAQRFTKYITIEELKQSVEFWDKLKLMARNRGYLLIPSTQQWYIQHSPMSIDIFGSLLVLGVYVGKARALKRNNILDINIPEMTTLPLLIKLAYNGIVA